MALAPAVVSTAVRSAPQPAAPGARPRRPAAWLIPIVLVMLAGTLVVRLAYTDATPGYQLVHDARDYDGHARSIAIGEGYSDTLAYGRPTAFRPPGYPYFLAAVYRVAGVERAVAAERIRAARIAGALVGTAIVALIGLLVAQLWGARLALVAMALGAVYVPLITVGAAVMSEPLFVVFMLGALSAALSGRRSDGRRRVAWALLAGALAGLAILTRANALVLLVPLALAVWDARPRWSGSALAPPVVLVLAAVLVVTPWTIRNVRTLHAFVPVSTQFGSALAGTYNDSARNDRENPASWRSLRGVPGYADIMGRVRQTPEAEIEKRLRARALQFIADHPTYVAVVAWGTTRRTLDLAGRDWSRHTAGTISIGRVWADRGVLCFWALALLALAGAATRRARAAPWFVWAFPALMFLSVVFLVVETPRYRTPLDPFIVVLAALALAAGAERLRAARR
jgi:4-amino-4-deoxy-L-arabinose transferase-like glycosyltransferase